jgi:hypothetical protein
LRQFDRSSGHDGHFFFGTPAKNASHLYQHCGLNLVPAIGHGVANCSGPIPELEAARQADFRRGGSLIDNVYFRQRIEPST